MTISTEQHCILGLFLQQNDSKQSHTEVVFTHSNRKAQTAVFRVDKQPLCQGETSCCLGTGCYGWKCRCKLNALSP